jgi:hypothetical protein
LIWSIGLLALVRLALHLFYEKKIPTTTSSNCPPFIQSYSGLHFYPKYILMSCTVETLTSNLNTLDGVASRWDHTLELWTTGRWDELHGVRGALEKSSPEFLLLYTVRSNARASFLVTLNRLTKILCVCITHNCREDFFHFSEVIVYFFIYV